MIDPELKAEFDEIKAKIDATFRSAEKTRKYIFWTAVVTAALVIIPLLVLPFVASSLFSTYSSALNL